MSVMSPSLENKVEQMRGCQAFFSMLAVVAMLGTGCVSDPTTETGPIREAKDEEPSNMGLAGYAKLLCSAVFISGLPEAEAREHSRRASARRQHRGHVKRHRPGLPARVDLCQFEMPGGPKDDFRRLQRGAACRRQAVQAILAQADDAQPGISHDTSPFARRHDRGLGPRPGTCRSGA